MPIIIGTAGHIDHGKSTLVRALTGTDPDRLPEEKRRGITVDLGYAFFGPDAAIIDVPGHERLIRNMVAGAATIDFALLVVAADDGVMPQTAEHLHILRLLGITEGCVVITKADLVESEWLALVEEQIRDAVRGTFLEDKPVYVVDALSGKGIAELSQSLRAKIAAIIPRRADGVFRLPVDRVFSVKGHGTVVTGTILSGSVTRDARLQILPGDGEVRVKHIETQGTEAVRLVAGQRAALNIVGPTELIERGCTLTSPHGLSATTRVLARCETTSTQSALKNNLRVRFLIGTQEVLGRLRILAVKPPHELYAELRFETKVVAAWHDHFILRRYSPVETLGGGIVLDPHTTSVKARTIPEAVSFCEALATQNVSDAMAQYIAVRGRDGIGIDVLARAFGITEARARDLLARASEGIRVEEVGGRFLSRKRRDAIAGDIVERIRQLHRQAPENHGFSQRDLRTKQTATVCESVFDFIVDDLVKQSVLVRDGGLLRHSSAHITVSAGTERLTGEILEILRRERFAPPSATTIAEQLGRTRVEIEKALVFMERQRICRRLGPDLFFATDVFESAVDAVRRAVSAASSLSVSDVAELLGSSRKYVVPFLEYLDAQGVTSRQGNVRVAGTASRNV